MNRPPYLMRIRIDKEGRKLNIWLPLFLILPVVAIIIAVIMLILAPVVLLAAAVLWPFGWGKPLLIAAPAVLDCLCALRGLEVDINHSQEKVFISIR